MTDFFPSVAPVFRVDGEVVGSLARDVVRLEILESTDGMKSLTLWLVARGPRPGDAGGEEEELLYLDGDVIDFGSALEVSIGPSDRERTVFRGAVSALEARFADGRDPHAVVYAEDALMALRMTHRMRTYEHQSDADIARTLAREHGLSTEVDAEGPTYPVVQQWNQSDLAFLRERARLIQAELWISQGALCFKSRSRRQGTSLTLAQGGDLVEIRVRADLAHQRTSIHVSGYDASSRDRFDEEAGDEAILAEVTGGRTGPAVLESAFGDRVSHRVRENPLASGEARAWAKAEMLRRARAFVTVAGVTNGSPEMVVGSALELTGVGSAFEGGGYYATRVCHTYDLTHGHRTQFEAERATVNAS